MVMMETIKASSPLAVVDDDAMARALNGVAVTVAQLEAAASLADELEEWNLAPAARHEALAAALGVDPIAAAAIAARIAGLHGWQDHSDPSRGTVESLAYDAASLAPLIATDDGIGFDHDRFDELVAFLSEMPW
jgi:hypothetical protein